MQRDRTFEHYQDLDLGYEARPSYWVEPRGNWGEGAHRAGRDSRPATRPTTTSSPTGRPRPRPSRARRLTWGYRITRRDGRLRAASGRGGPNTWQTQPRALGSSEQPDPSTRRFIIDFAGGDLAYYLSDPERVQIVPSISNGRILRTFLVPNTRTEGFRAGIDVAVEKGQSADLRAFLKAGNRALTETWTFPWRPE